MYLKGTSLWNFTLWIVYACRPSLTGNCNLKDLPFVLHFLKGESSWYSEQSKTTNGICTTVIFEKHVGKSIHVEIQLNLILPLTESIILNCSRW